MKIRKIINTKLINLSLLFAMSFTTILQTYSQTPPPPQPVNPTPSQPKEVHTKDALLLYKEKQYDEAIALTKEEIAKNPEKVDSYVVLGWSCLAKKDYASAIEWMNKIILAHPTEQRVLDIIGEANFFIGEYLTAIGHFENYLKVDTFGFKGTTADVYHYLGLSYLKTSELLKSEISLRAYLQFKGEDVDTLLTLAYIKEKMGDKKEALRYYQQILSKDSAVKEAQYGVIRLENS